VEEHGSGRQLLRARIWPLASTGGLLVAAIEGLIAATAWREGHPELGIAFVAASLALLAVILEGTATATALAIAQIGAIEREPEQEPEWEPEQEPEPQVAGAADGLAAVAEPWTVALEATAPLQAGNEQELR
jgi:hypothetical protein